MTVQGFAGHVKIVRKFLKKEAGDLLLIKMRKTAKNFAPTICGEKLYNLKNIIIFFESFRD